MMIERIECLIFRHLHRRLLIQMGSSNLAPRVYTLPECSHCTELKKWLEAKGIPFEERVFDTEAQLEFIMRNMFGNPPIIEVGSRIIPSEELFIHETLDEEKVREALASEKA